MKFWLGTFLFFVCAAVAQASPVEVNVARKAGNVYEFELKFVAMAPAQQVAELLTDYDNISLLNPLIKSSQILPSKIQNATRVEVISQGCTMFFCKTIRRVEDVSVEEDLTIKSTYVPELSDFKSGETEWMFMSQGDSTLVSYRLSMVPDFWLPPLIGPRSLKKELSKQLYNTANTINSLLAE